MNLNRLANVKNKFQGDRKKVLCVCSAGLLRSPTLAWVLSNAPYNYNTRSCGAAPEYALIPLDEYLIAWADEILCVEKWQEKCVLNLNPNANVTTLEIDDKYGTRDPELIAIIETKLKEHYNDN
jgi:predicted protein tyrosine phosphatase